MRKTMGALLCAVVLLGMNARAAITTYYVKDSMPDDGADGLSWDTAKKTIQAAVDLTITDDIVLVTNGVYNLGGKPATGLALTNRVMVYNKKITVMAVSTNPADTVIEGAADPSTVNGPAAVRGAYLSAMSTLANFTIRYGHASNTGVSDDKNGGGVYAPSGAGIVSNCIVTECGAIYGGGVSRATCYDSRIVSNATPTVSGAYGGGTYYVVGYGCLIASNLSYNGGGAYAGTLYDCTVQTNRAQNWGGGMYSTTAYDTHVLANIAGSYGGGSLGGTFTRCEFVENRGSGAAAREAVFYQCVLRGNVVNHGFTGVCNGGTLTDCLVVSNSQAGSYGYILSGANARNCTLADNLVSSQRGGVYLGSLTNCILYGNVGQPFWSCTNVSYTCAPTTNGLAGPGNIQTAPDFVGGGDYRLSKDSPCIDAGMDLAAAGVVTDLAGTTRPLDGDLSSTAEYDMGCYEFIPPPGGTVIMFR